MSAAPPLGWVQIKSIDPPVTLLARLSGDRPNVDAGYGGWSEVARPRRRPLAVWVGSPALRVSLPIIFDRLADNVSIERQISQLEKIATATGTDGTPPRIHFVAQGSAVPHQSSTWVIDSLAWGDAIMNSDGNRVRQQVTLSLLEWMKDVRVQVNSPANLQRLKVKLATPLKGAGSKRVVAKHGSTSTVSGTSARVTARAVTSDDFGQGEDLLSIAARELGDASRWPEIASLNGIRDPRSIVPGQILRLP
jgi:hypothetical protein